MARCKATNANGTRCDSPEHLVNPETGLCQAHAPGGSERMAEIGRKGAEALRDKYRRPNVQAGAWTLESPADAQEWLKRIAGADLAGAITHHQANAAAKALKTWLQAHDAGSVTDQLEEFRDIVAELNGERKLRSVK